MRGEACAVKEEKKRGGVRVLSCLCAVKCAFCVVRKVYLEVEDVKH